MVYIRLLTQYECRPVGLLVVLLHRPIGLSCITASSYWSQLYYCIVLLVSVVLLHRLLVVLLHRHIGLSSSTASSYWSRLYYCIVLLVSVVLLHRPIGLGCSTASSYWSQLYYCIVPLPSLISSCTQLLVQDMENACTVAFSAMVKVQVDPPSLFSLSLS